jgi:DNA-binding GntR family transcriptional regulator
MQPKKLTHADRLEMRRKMARAVRDGKLPASVASEFGVSLETVRRALVENGIHSVRVFVDSNAPQHATT